MNLRGSVLGVPSGSRLNTRSILQIDILLSPRIQLRIRDETHLTITVAVSTVALHVIKHRRLRTSHGFHARVEV